MTTIDAADATCRGCAAPWRPGARFCPRCGNQAPPVSPAPRRSGPQAAVPTQRWVGPPEHLGPPRHPGPPPGPYVPPWAPPFPPVGPPPAPEQRRSSRGLIVIACVLALVAVVLGAFLVVGMPWSAGAGTTTAGGTTPAPGTVPASPALPADPAQALQVQRGADAGAAEALVGSWAPQLSAKKPGLVVDGQTYDAATILADHERLRTQQPGAILVWSGDYTSFRSSDFWITLANRPFSSAEAANAWCASAGFGPDDCYAKRLAHSGGYAANTAMRTDAGTGTTGGGTAAGATPVLGDPAWTQGGAGWGVARPPEINANGDGSSYITGVTWQSWGGAQATGRGTASYVGPNATVSEGVQRPAVVVATNLGDCHGRLAYRSVGWYFPTEGETSLPPGNGYEDICDGT